MPIYSKRRHNKSKKYKTKIVLKKGLLGKHGYKNIKYISKKKREKALESAIKEFGPLSVMRKINILYVFSKRFTRLRRIYKQDKEWIYKHYEVKKNGKRIK